MNKFATIFPIDIKVSDMNARIRDTIRIFGVIFRSNPDKTIIVQIDLERIQTG